MESKEKTKITVQTIVNAPIERVWKLWTDPEHIMQWNNASPDWHTPKASNDLKVGGKFSFYMAAKDGSFGFDFNGIYDEVKNHELLSYTIEGGRKVSITFNAQGSTTEVIEIFEAEDVNSIELQKGGWQAILNNFKAYTESN